MNVLLKSISYFNVKSIGLNANSEALREQISSKYPNMKFDLVPCDLIFLDVQEKESQELRLFGEIHNDTIVLVNNIYKSKSLSIYWEAIKAHEKVTVTLDLFYCGVIFFRKEQAKEHFKIRI